MTILTRREFLVRGGGALAALSLGPRPARTERPDRRIRRIWANPVGV